MSKQSINNYYSKISQYKRFGGTRNETSVRRAFANLLEEYCLSKNLVLVDEVHLKSSAKRPDGTVRNASQLDWGFWESKDPKDNLNEEISKKIEIGYPTFNIIFENSEQIVLIQKGEEVLRGEMKNVDFLHRILTAFIDYERPEITEFRLAVEKFKEDVPDIVEALRAMIEVQATKNPDFRTQREKFWNICRESINPEISAFDIREMLIQHILTAEIFDTVFGDSHFHRENNIARELEIVVNTFFTGAVRRDTLASVDNYYKAIKREASNIDNHHEKQKFLKVIYETFYKAYNPKGADRLGVVYTPNEIVKFMVESTDYLLEKYFNKSLADKNVQILDPATGTGTFITEIIEYIPEQYLKEKYKNEIHCNELAILPYYIANLNIEYTYQQKMRKYEPFENIVFVDTLDNLGFDYVGKQQKMYAMTTENLERIKNQNEKKISVIIGNPPYNANQQNENDNNKNKVYKELDQRIKDTYIKQSTAQKTKVYDMYARFYRWASDRIDKNGIIAFVTNRSFIDSRTFDGFRKSMLQEFDFVYIIDLNGDLRSGKEEATGNVFGIKVGVAITFCVKKQFFDLNSKKQNKDVAKIYYTSIFRTGTAKEKLEYLYETKFRQIPFESIKPDKNSNWIEIPENDFDNLCEVVNRNTKLNKINTEQNALFKLFSLGVVTSRDEWVVDDNELNLSQKIQFFIKQYNSELLKYKGSAVADFVEKLDYSIKWSRAVKKDLSLGKKYKFLKENIKPILYRPYCSKNIYFAQELNEMQYQIPNILPANAKNKLILVSIGKRGNFSVLSTDKIPSLDIFMPNATQCIPLFRYDKAGNRLDNLTDWGLKQFTEHYKNESITKEDIFHYTYGVLHNPAYTQKYELNLKREFPRLPFYQDFYKWVSWGQELMDLHIGYETVESYELGITNYELKDKPKCKLKAMPENGEIILDENTSISGIPKLAWEYKFGNRSALHWVLDQYKEKKPTDKTIAEKFNTYKFADYKETVIDLIKRLTTVSIRTMEIIKLMEIEETHNF